MRRVLCNDTSTWHSAKTPNLPCLGLLYRQRDPITLFTHCFPRERPLLVLVLLLSLLPRGGEKKLGGLIRDF